MIIYNSEQNRKSFAGNERKQSMCVSDSEKKAMKG